MSEWKPGMVAVVTVRDRFGRSSETFGLVDESGDWTTLAGLVDGDKARPRAVVVIDPEDDEQVGRFLVHLLSASTFDVGQMQAALREFARPTPRIEEPQGLGAVVEDEKGKWWVRLNHEPPTDDPWKPYDSRTRRCAWADIHAVRVLNPGVEAES